MKYIEELKPGDAFAYRSNFFVATVDKRSGGRVLCYNLKDGTPRWLKAHEMVEISQVFVLDEENNIVAIKETKKEDVNAEA